MEWPKRELIRISEFVGHKPEAVLQKINIAMYTDIFIFMFY